MALPPQERYQYKPFVGSSHSWAFSQLKRHVSKGPVLDVGPGSGVFGQVLKAQNIGPLHAVEIDPEARAHAATIYDQVSDSIDTFAGNTYQAILLLDVLEHMANPLPFYNRCVEMLAPGGVVLVSVPNIAHWSVRFMLLMGRFEPAQRGILDGTHLKHFSRRGFRKLLDQRTELGKTITLGASIEPAEFVLPKWVWDNAAFRALSAGRTLFARALPGLMAFQHLGAFQKNPS
jgi:SAM-dependent methyltransferase